MPPLPPRDEAASILSLTGNNTLESLRILQDQLNVLFARAQVLLSLSGVVITVTGFSGRLIAATNPVAQTFLVAGLGTVLVSAVWVFLLVMRVRWVTAETADDPNAALERIISRRNSRTRAYVAGGLLLCIGLALYVVAISVMLFNPDQPVPPAR